MQRVSVFSEMKDWIYLDRLPKILDVDIFLEYQEFIERCKKDPPKEGKLYKHHIIPKVFLHTDQEKKDTANLVLLTYVQHVEAHRLLADCLDCEQMRIAYGLMTCKDKEEMQYLYQKARERLRQLNQEHGGVYHTERYIRKMEKRRKERAEQKERERLARIEQEKPKKKTWLETIWIG